MSLSSAQLVAFIRSKIKGARKRLIQVHLAKGLLILLGGGAAIWALLAILEGVFWFQPAFRWGLLIVSAAILVTLFSVYVIWPLLLNTGLIPSRNDAYLARLIGRQFPEVGDSLLNFLQLSEGRHSASSDEFVDQAVARLGEPLKVVPFENATSWSILKTTSTWAIALILLLLVCVIAAPTSFLSATTRVLQPTLVFEKPAPYAFQISPGDAEVIIGESVTVAVDVTGAERPSETPVLESIIDGELRSRFVNLSADSLGTLGYTFSQIRQSFRYRISAPEVTSPWYSVRLVERPLIQEFAVTVRYPGYTRMPARQLDVNVGDFSALVGSSVDLTATLAGADASEAWVQFESGRTIDMALLGNRATASFTVNRNDSYYIALVTADGISNLDPIAYSIESVLDGFPSVTLLSPAPLVDLSDELSLTLLAHVTDDFGFLDLKLNYRLAESRFSEEQEGFNSISIPLDNTYVLDQEIGFAWSFKALSGLDPVPGDVFEYFVEVRDNDAVAGFKSAQSRVHRARMPSIAEQYESLEEKKSDTQASMEELMEKADQAREQFEELKSELMQKPEAEWQDERMLEQLQQKEADLEQTVDEISSQMEEMAQQMSENEMVSEQTMEMFEELQNVVEEVRTPELMDALKQLQQAIENLDVNQMQEALEKFEFSEEMYQDRLERTLDLFKDLRMKMDMEEIEKRAEDLAKTEEKLAEETAKLQNEEKSQDSSGENKQPDEKKEDLANQQELAAEDMKKLEEKMEEVRERMEDLKNSPKEDMQDLLEDTQDQKLSQEMNQNAEQMKQDELQKAQEGQQKMSEQLSQLSAQMDQMQMSMQGAQMQLNIAAIRAALEDVLTLSKEQEVLRLEISDLSPESPLLRPAAQTQTRLLEGLSSVSDSLQQIAKEIPQMTRDIQQQAGDGMREMAEATDALTERAARRASGYQRAAMTNLNELALMLSELLNQQMNGSGAGQSNQSMEQMMESLQQMGQQQQQLNQQIQQLLNDMQGSKLTNELTDRLKQLGSQQEKMRNELRQMSREKNARNKMLGDLNRIADQMMESIQEMQQNKVSGRTVERQNQILTRLLEASKSMQERGKDKKREGKSAEQLLRESPADLPPNERLERLRKDLIRALETGYSSDYQALIRRYFEILQEETGQLQN